MNIYVLYATVNILTSGCQNIKVHTQDKLILKKSHFLYNSCKLCTMWEQEQHLLKSPLKEELLQRQQTSVQKSLRKCRSPWQHKMQKLSSISFFL